MPAQHRHPHFAAAAPTRAAARHPRFAAAARHRHMPPPPRHRHMPAIRHRRFAGATLPVRPDWSGAMLHTEMRAPCFVLISLVLGACAGSSSAPPPQTPQPVYAAPPPGSATSPADPGGQQQVVQQTDPDSRACCTPQGAYDPSDTSYNDCVQSGGRPWGSDGCGQTPDGKIIAPPPSMAPGP